MVYSLTSSFPETSMKRLEYIPNSYKVKVSTSAPFLSMNALTFGGLILSIIRYYLRSSVALIEVLAARSIAVAVSP